MDPSIETHLKWEKDKRFSGQVGSAPVVLDGSSEDTLSPMQAVAAGLAGCMAIDIAMILTKGRQPIEGLEITLSGSRNQDPPRHFTAITMHFRVTGAVDEKKVERAIELSRTRYYSVLHSLREDLELSTSFSVEPGSG